MINRQSLVSLDIAPEATVNQTTDLDLVDIYGCVECSDVNWEEYQGHVCCGTCGAPWADPYDEDRDGYDEEDDDDE